VDPLHDLAEARLREAIDEGLFRDLPGFGKPLQLADDAGLPEELRGAYALLRSAGCLPEEMELSAARVRLRDLIESVAEGDERALLEARERDLALRYELLMERRRGAPSLGGYRGSVLRRPGR